MRLTPEQIEVIRRATRDVAGPGARVRLFGSRLDDAIRGGDIDLLLECEGPTERPALLAARLSARISRQLDGRKIDVVVLAPNLRLLPIHESARREGVLL